MLVRSLSVAYSEVRMRFMTTCVRGFFLAWLLSTAAPGLLLASDDLRLDDDQPLRMPPVGSYQLRVLSPTMLELTLITTKPPDPAPVAQWNFVEGGASVPDPGDFTISADSRPIAIKRVAFKRRVLYAPPRKRDLRIGNYLYLELSGKIGDNQTVVVSNPRHDLWSATVQFTATE